jgi:hypothetical protein
MEGQCITEGRRAAKAVSDGGTAAPTSELSECQADLVSRLAELRGDGSVASSLGAQRSDAVAGYATGRLDMGRRQLDIERWLSTQRRTDAADGVRGRHAGNSQTIHSSA